MSPKVSVIVPVYNAAAYLPHCLDTLACQTLKELEIILVLDRPTDGSEKIAEDYAARFPQIRLLYNEKNLHAGESRNRGLDVATGEYIGFVDADDFVEARMFEDMYLTAKERNADVVLTDRQTCSPGEEPAVTLKDRAALQVQGGEEFLRSQLLAMVEGQFGLALSWLYTHLYRREFLQRHGLRLADSRGMMSEDLLFNVQVYRILLDEGGKWVYLPQAYYHYVVYEGSLCHSPGFYTFAMTVPLVDNLAFEMCKCTTLPFKEVEEALGMRMVRNFYGAWCKEVRLYGVWRACKDLVAACRVGLVRETLKDVRLWRRRDLSLRKRVFAVWIWIITLR